VSDGGCDVSLLWVAPGHAGPDGDALDRSGVFFEALFPLFFAQARLTGMIEAQEMQRGKLFGMTA
jgi:hypothetical protein